MHNFKNNIYLILAVLGLRCFTAFSLLAASEAYSLAVLCRPLIAAASLSVEHRPAARGIFLDQGMSPCLLHWQADSYPQSHQPQCTIFKCVFAF